MIHGAFNQLLEWPGAGYPVICKSRWTHEMLSVSGERIAVATLLKCHKIDWQHSAACLGGEVGQRPAGRFPVGEDISGNMDAPAPRGLCRDVLWNTNVRPCQVQYHLSRQMSDKISVNKDDEQAREWKSI